MFSKRLTKNLKNENEKRQFLNDWAAAAPSRKILSDLLQERIDLVRRQRLDKDEYSNPAYAIKQAALNEQERCYQELKDLLDN
ncbi:MAG: hypothetical protein OQK25_07870 [Gammaproteobacteria bacterium]|nr:hypothetical protein [Gammaproteobacteria bacterium]MCW8982490.1 hypothetical protein [Gammaproteobacteria bacterium]